MAKKNPKSEQVAVQEVVEITPEQASRRAEVERLLYVLAAKDQTPEVAEQFEILRLELEALQ